jgi:serine/threonine protein kinase
MTVDTASWVGRTLQGGRYEVIARLGAGGMAVVYRARDHVLERDVVLKVPRSTVLLEPGFVGRFPREVKALARLAHAHIVKVIDAGDDGGIPFAILEYLPGGSLRDRQRREGKKVPLPAGSLHDWLPGVAAALDHIHAHHFLHRDVKPDNILFDAHGHVYLSDFGIVKTVEESPQRATVLTRAGTVLGTPPYMAPELLLGEPYDSRVDQYALAVTVYEVLTGRQPVEGTNPAAILVKWNQEPPPPLHVACPGTPPGLSAAVARALSHDPKQRWPDCTTFARAVLAALPPADPATPPPPLTPLPEAPPIQMACPHCRKRFRMRAGSLTKQYPCPSCGGEFLIPEAVPATSPAPAPVVETVVAAPEQTPTPPAGRRGVLFWTAVILGGVVALAWVALLVALALRLQANQKQPEPEKEQPKTSAAALAESSAAGSCSPLPRSGEWSRG